MYKYYLLWFSDGSDLWVWRGNRKGFVEVSLTTKKVHGHFPYDGDPKVGATKLTPKEGRGLLQAFEIDLTTTKK